MDLTGQAVIVTGSSSGIGAAVARRLDTLGAGVVVNSSSSREAGEKIASELRDAVYVQGDIGDPATAENLVRAATERWGRLDGLVNNAGCTVSVPLADLDSVGVEHWEKVLRTNVIGTFLVSQACLPLLRAAPESWIVNVTSLAGTRQTGSSFPYAVSKAAVNHMTTLLAKFVGEQRAGERRRARPRRHAVDRDMGRPSRSGDGDGALASRRERRRHRRRGARGRQLSLRERFDADRRRGPRARL